MKKLTPYLPFALVAVAAIAALYFFWYKPKKDAEDTANAAAQAAKDAELFNDPLASTPIPMATKATKGTKFKANPALLALLNNN